MVYVDDFKLAGPKENLARGWELVRGGLDVDEPGEINLYLGCKHERVTKVINGRSVTSMTYNMEDYFTAIVDDYEKRGGSEPSGCCLAQEARLAAISGVPSY